MFDKVLLIAINDYQGCTSLQGCLNDADDIYRAMVARQRYNSEQIRYLANDRATRDAIMRDLAWLGNARRGFLFYAGHGTLTPELEPALVSSDCDRHWHDPVSKVQIKALCSDMAGTVVIDCCHSGSLFARGQRDFAGYRERYLPNPLVSREAVERKLAEAGTADASAPHVEDSPRVYLCGCDNPETAKEVFVEGKPRGIFSFALGKALRARPDIDVVDLWREVSREVKEFVRARDMSPQTPQLWCRKDYLSQTFLRGDA